MTIIGVPGAIGSSAAKETGKWWVSDAASAVRVGTPFWMSELSGLSVWNARIKISGEHPPTGTWFLGAWSEKGNISWNTLFDSRGEISGINGTGFELGAFGVAKPDTAAGINESMSIRGEGNFDSDWRVFLDGANFLMKRSRSYRGWHTYACTDPWGLWRYLLERDGGIVNAAFIQSA